MDFPKWGWWGLCTRNQDKELLRFLCQCTSANIRPRSKHFAQKMFYSGQRKKIEGSIHSDEYRTIKKKQNHQNILKRGLHWTNIAFQSFANPPQLTVIGNIRILFSDHFPGPLACTPTDLVSKKKANISAAVQFSLFSALAAFLWSPPNPGVKGHLWTSGRLKEQRKLEYTRLSKNPVFSGWF